MQEIAESRGGKCLSELYVNAHTKSLWECANEHQWKATPDSIKRGTWCPICGYRRSADAAKLRRLNIEEMQEIAESRGGKCLSDTYLNAHTKLIWRCSIGHRWEAKPNSIQQGAWCPECRGKTKLKIQDMYRLAKDHGGKCLSSTYVNSRTKLLWECKVGHRWKATPNNIQQGKWCAYCSGRIKLTIDEMRQIAKARGGKCISNKYINNQTNLLWECSEGHRWEAVPNSIKHGSWCRKCAGLEKLTIDYMQNVAEERGGKCLSKKYQNARLKLLWECSEGHRWKATYDKIGQGSWCPECSAGMGERICREFFKQLFSNDFPKSYPKWLVNEKGNQMELDGHCESLGLAFEHQGEQHYTTKSHLINSKHDLSRIKFHDKLKRRLCDKRDVTLIPIPEIPNRLPVDEVKDFIKKQCELKGFPLPTEFDSIKVNLKSAYTNPSSRKILNVLKAIANEKGGKCLSKVYKGDNKKLLWECSEGHQWKAIPGSIKQNTWCPHCAGTVAKTIEQMHQLAKERGGRCSSNAYAGIYKKLLWECAKGHKWKAIPKHIIKGHWCPYCAGRGKTIEDMQKLAKERGGKCISTAFLGARKKLLWECSRGHQWTAIPDSIRRGSWCPQCRGSKKHTIEEMRQLAKRQGGKCLSKTYSNNSSKLLWECANGHQWKAIYSSIKRGRWCPVCRSNKYTIEQMQKLAQEHDGKCLSSQYVNLRTELLWECRSGHRWKDQPRRIKDGGWCRECRRKN